MRVVKIGGRAQNDPALAAKVREAWDDSRNSLCVVHGGGDEISSLQRLMGKEPLFVGGRRVTSREDIEVLRMVLSGTVNKRLVSAFSAAGAPAVGLSGEDGSLIVAEMIDADSLGYAGRPRKINDRLLHSLMRAGYMPVISPVAAGITSTGVAVGALNVNGDDAAAAIAAALDAEELLLIADVEGVRDGEGQTIPSLSMDQAHELVANGVAGGGMAAKLEAASKALLAGVERVRVCDLHGLSDGERGTFITQSQGVVT
jgi:acetylglutamate kinase